MVDTPSVMLPLGTEAHSFSLYDTVSKNTVSLEELRSDEATVIMFICNHCPFVKRINQQLVSIANDYKPSGVSFVAISSNDVERYPQDSPENMGVHARAEGYAFPYLYDETQAVARSYKAVCTPDFYIFDAALRCVYRGQLDDSRPGSDIPVTGKDIRNALDAILSGERPTEDQKPSLGCGIKWKNTAQ